jgi:hypothetical protein
MSKSMKFSQRGVGFGGFMMWAVLLVVGSLVGMKVIPVYMENAEISHLFAQVANDATVQKWSQFEIKDSLRKQASINNIKALKVEDVKIINDNGRASLSYTYTSKLPLVSNISLSIDFISSSDKK